MKKTFLFIVTSFLFLSITAQERINAPKQSFEVISDKFTDATGWYYNEIKGEWIDNKNLICKDKIESIYTYHASKEDNNFISIQTKKLLHNNTFYYAIFLSKYKGYYKYPNIQSDWTITTDNAIYIFSKNEFDKIKNIDGEIVLTSIYKLDLLSINDSDNEVINKISNLLDKEVSKYPTKFYFKIKKADDGSIRFLIPNFYFTIDKIDFEKRYFEATFENFEKIMIE